VIDLKVGRIERQVGKVENAFQHGAWLPGKVFVTDEQKALRIRLLVLPGQAHPPIPAPDHAQEFCAGGVAAIGGSGQVQRVACQKDEASLRKCIEDGVDVEDVGGRLLRPARGTVLRRQVRHAARVERLRRWRRTARGFDLRAQRGVQCADVLFREAARLNQIGDASPPLPGSELVDLRLVLEERSFSFQAEHRRRALQHGHQHRVAAMLAGP